MRQILPRAANPGTLHEKGESMNQAARKTNKDFIMSPKVDVCFAGLMENPKVRRGFCAAILRVPPETIEKTELLPTYLQRDCAEDKLGILDVHIRMADGSRINMEMQVKEYEFWDERVLFYLSKMFSGQLKSGEDYENLKKCIHVSILDFIHFPEDRRCCRTLCFCDTKTGEIYNDKMEIQVLELKKLPKKIRKGEELVNWMRFFNGKSKEDFRRMAKESIFLEEAYETLQRLSADDIKRLEYEAREKALRDHNSFVGSARRQGERIGEKRGEKNGIELAKKVFKLHTQGKTEEEIASECSMDVEKVREILE